MPVLVGNCTVDGELCQVSRDPVGYRVTKRAPQYFPRKAIRLHKCVLQFFTFRLLLLPLFRDT